MSNHFMFLMRLCGNAAHGKATETCPMEIDWSRIVQLARQHMLHPLVGYALKISPSLNCPQEIWEACLGSMQHIAVLNSMRCSEMLSILREMEQDGIPNILLKGFDAAQNYAVPAVRVSGDTDVWVDPNDEFQATRILTEKGFAFDKRNAESHHAVAHHPTLGCLELHTNLYDDFVEEYWFQDKKSLVMEQRITVNTEYGAYAALGYTDNLLFQTLHLVKHFIMSGASLRAMLDIALFFERHREEVDTERYWRILHELKYDQLVSTVYQCMLGYGAFPEGSFPGVAAVKEEQIKCFLDDLESGGWLGMTRMEESLDGWHAYHRQIMRRQHSEKEYRWIMVRRRIRSLASGVFPRRSTLEKRYPMLKNKPWLLPFVWIHRTVTRTLQVVSQGGLRQEIITKSDQISEISKERLQLFEKLGMI